MNGTSPIKADCTLPPPDPSLDEEYTDWCTLHSLTSLRLTLDYILCDCVIPTQLPLVEFPLKTEVDPPLTKVELPLRTLPPRVRLNGEQLALKKSQLKSVIKLYKEHINELNQGSRAIFGSVRGDRICLLVDTSDLHVFGEDVAHEDECGDEVEEEREDARQEFVECRCNLRKLFEEEFSEKSKVYLLQLGSEVSEDIPTALNFSKYKQRCILIAQQWLDSLRGSGSCSLLRGLEKALALTDIDTLLIVMGSRPDEDRATVTSYVRDRLTGISGLHLHWVAHQCNKDTTAMLFQLASDTGAQFHSYSRSSSSADNELQVVDTDINTVTTQLKQAEMILSELETLQSEHLHMSDNLLHALIQLNIGMGHVSTAGLGPDEQMPVTSAEWLKDHSLNASGLNIYSVLAPNAYSQLNVEVVHSPDTHTVVSSVVYDDMMPRITWHDGSQKYLHVDVHQIENYEVDLKAYIGVLQQRLNWLTSGSRAPFGVISENSVLLLVEVSAATLPFISQLQSNLHLLLNEQLSHTKEFNIMRIGGDGESSVWQRELTKQTRESIREAWVWLLSQSPAGGISPMPTLESVFSGDSNSTDLNIGVYLIVSSMPKDDMERVCSYLCEKTAHVNVHIHAIYYRHTPATSNHAVAALSFEEESYANDQELTHCLRQIAKAGRGRFHSFRGPDAIEDDDIDCILRELEKSQNHLQMASKILEDYNTFCKRYVPSPPLTPSPPPLSDPPPLYPRPTTAFLSRLNTTSKRLAKSASDSQLSSRCLRQTKSHHPTRRAKTYAFYLDNGFEKGMTLERGSWPEINNHRKKSIVKSISTAEWLSRFGLESVGLNFSQYEVQKVSQRRHKATYKHINKKGEVVELYTNHHGLKRYVGRLKQAEENYLAKFNELSEGWCQVFGRIIESKVLLVIDISSSMAGCFEALRAALTNLLENRPHTLKHFNMVTYSSSVRKWQESLVPCTDENLAMAVQWIAQLKPGGSSCLLNALKVSLQSGVNSIYLITDGTADHTHDFLLSQIPQLRMWYGDTWTISTVAYHCTVESSYRFMKKMAHDTGGRYHSYPWVTAAHPAQLLHNTFLGDDARRITQEIVSADDYFQRASQYL